MKHSIHKIFKNLNLFLLISLVLGSLSFLFIVEQYFSYEKVSNLNNQKKVYSSFVAEQRVSNVIDFIQFNAKSAQLRNDTQALLLPNQYAFLSSILLDNQKEYSLQINQLNSLSDKYIKLSREYFELLPDDKNIPLLLIEIESLYISILDSIDSVLLNNIINDSQRFSVFFKLFIVLLLVLIIANILQRQKLQTIYADIILLSSNDLNKSTPIYSQEMDAIALRMNRKTSIADNPTMIDQVTEINNNKGMAQTYLEKKGLKDNNFNSVTILEIDNFSKSKRAFSQGFTQEILKKVAYTISLHETAIDIIARTDYNQFTLIFSRPSKEQLYKDIDLVRQSISEIKLSTPEKDMINITVTGGFIIKPNNAPLEDYIRKSKELLKDAKHLGINKILQTKDLPK